MVANELLNQYKSLPDAINYIGVEDFPDRLNFLFTVTVLLVCCSVVTVRTYVFHPLACFIPNSFGSGIASQEHFVNNYCWTEGTYAVHPSHFVIDASLPDAGLGRYKDKRITYYQWVPLVLGVQCIMFYLPRVLWNFVTNQRSGTDVAHILRTVHDASQADQDKHDRLMQHACRRLEQLLNRSHQLSDCPALRRIQRFALNRFGIVLSTQQQGNSIVLCYLGIKLVYFVNASCQLALMQRFLNMINEKLYVFLWFWIAFVAAATALSLITWTIRVYSGRNGSSFVRRYLRLADNYDQLRNNPWLKKFELEFLRNDGTFLLKMIALNCGDVACTEVLRGLWARFLRLNGVHRTNPPAAAQSSVTVKNLVVIPTSGKLERATISATTVLNSRPLLPSAPPAFDDQDDDCHRDGSEKGDEVDDEETASKRRRRLGVQRSISTNC